MLMTPFVGHHVFFPCRGVDPGVKIDLYGPLGVTIILFGGIHLIKEKIVVILNHNYNYLVIS